MLPTTTMLFNSDRTGNNEIYSMDLLTGHVTQLTSNAAYDSWWARVSPHRDLIIFYRTPKGVYDTDASQNTLWMMNADGSNQHEILGAKPYGWLETGHAEWWPDQTKLVMQGGLANPQIFFTNTDGSNPVQLTNHPGTNIDCSPHPSMTSIVFSGVPDGETDTKANSEVMLLSTSTYTIGRVTTDAYQANDPYFRPDGQKISWLQCTDPVNNHWGLYLTNPDGSGRATIIDDGNINSRGVWSSDSLWLYFHRLILNPLSKWDIWQIHPDGTGLGLVTVNQSGNNCYPGM